MEEVKMRKCSHCLFDKSLSEFGLYKNVKSGLRRCCKVCMSEKKRIATKHRNFPRIKGEYKCSQCLKIKNSNDFYSNKLSLNGLRSECKECAKMSVRQRVYGISREECTKITKLQYCQNCNSPSKTKKSLNIDHCHKTGRVRGVLCHHCNCLLGYAREDVNILKSAINYLKRHQEKPIIPRKKPENFQQLDLFASMACV